MHGEKKMGKGGTGCRWRGTAWQMMFCEGLNGGKRRKGVTCLAEDFIVTPRSR